MAAASILARDEFVKRLAGLGKDYGVELPRARGDERRCDGKGCSRSRQ